MEELASSISDFIGSSWRAPALMDRVRDRIGDCLHFKAANRAIASDAAGILAAIQCIVRRSQRLVRPARLFVVRNAGPREPEGRQGS